MTRAPALTLALATAAALAAAAPAALARSFDAGHLHIENAWIRLPPPGAPTAAGYLTIENRGKTADRLLGGSSPLAGSIEPHAMSMAGGVMRMRELKDGFEIRPGATLVLAPGGDHLMLVGPKRALKAGESVPATLKFAHAGTVRVTFTVASEAPAAARAHDMPGMDMR